MGHKPQLIRHVRDRDACRLTKVFVCTIFSNIIMAAFCDNSTVPSSDGPTTTPITNEVSSTTAGSRARGRGGGGLCGGRTLCALLSHTQEGMTTSAAAPDATTKDIASEGIAPGMNTSVVV